VKGSRDFVTGVDRTAERMVSAVLLAAEPDSRIVGEELQPEIVTGGLVWIVDPLDGTTNFLHDFPSYAVSVAGAIDGVLEVAAVVSVPTGDTYTASRGGGAWLGERRLTVSAIEDPAFALIGTGFPFKDTSRLAEYLEQFGRVAGRTSGIRRPGAASLIRGCRGGTVRWLLGAVPVRLGHRRGHTAHPRGRGGRHRPPRPGHRYRAHRTRGRQSGDPPMAPGDDVVARSGRRHIVVFSVSSVSPR
jgi:hypothetical protein